jgi:transposase
MVHGPVARGLGTVSCCSHKHSHTLFSLMPHQKSNDIKACIPFLYFREGYKVKDICRILGLGKTLVYECIQNYMQHQVAHRLHYYQSCGCPRIVKHAHVNFIHQCLSTCHSHYLDKLQTELFHTFNIHLSLPTISRTLHRTSLSRKQLLRQAIGVFLFHNWSPGIE